MKSTDFPGDTCHAVIENMGRSGGALESFSEVLDQESPNSIPQHPLGVKPSGNQYTARSNARSSVGPAFQVFPDEMLAIFLEFLDSMALLRLGSTCKFLHAFCKADDLWKALFIESSQSKLGSFAWRRSWRSTLLQQDSFSRVSCDNVFSDVLHRPFLCAHASLAPYTSNIPRANAISRLEDLSPSEFSEHWSDKPFILTKPVREWPVYKSWDVNVLLQRYANVKFRAEAVDWTLKTYMEYMRNNSDESPLYLFDRSFVEKMELSVGKSQDSPSYWAPECFGEDLFAVLGDKRPDDKWLIIGPERSGSTYHKDPNATSAWNAVLKGSKYWIMFPSTTSSPPPPGVYVSEDQSEVTSPLSIAEWLLCFHAEARQTPGCVEGVCGEGEVLHVPSGWWHLVINIDASIAITQNFVPHSHLTGVLSFLKDKPDQVSGFKKRVGDPYKTFIDHLNAEHPELLSQALERLERVAEGKKRKWGAAIAKDESETDSGFSFGFGNDDDEVP